MFDAEGSVAYFHNDAIGTPLRMTDASQAVVWDAETLPFGETVPVAGPIQNNLRFPGQYFDVETGLHQNWHRDYSPVIGRYFEADPLIVTNLRLPGQHDERLLGSLGLQGPYYNWNRWYLPGVGRYLESGPIAMAGGFNLPFAPDWYGYVMQNPLRWVDFFGLYPGQMPPLPPGYSWWNWLAVEFDTGWALEAPDGRLFFPHPEDKGHWRHWDIQKPGGGSGGRWPFNSLKPWPGQKRPKPNQCTTDPSGDAPAWESPPPSGLYEGGAPDAPFTPVLPMPGPLTPMPFPMPGPTPVPVW